MKNKNRRMNLLMTGPVALATFLVATTPVANAYANGASLDTDLQAAGIPLALRDIEDSDAVDQPQIFIAAGPDNDGDGIDNDVDPDDDDDRIKDVDEGLIDADGDGIPDPGSTDTDGDGVPDGLDDDSDNDGIPDWDEAGLNGHTPLDPPVDTDNDGIPDFRDPESDGDGIYDLVEAGGTDTDGDGIVDNFTDTTGKGIDDTIHASSLPVFDTDLDGLHDYRDLDSDDDSLPDQVEAGANPTAPLDSDGDGATDYRELDSDDDGIPDDVEAGPNPAVPEDEDGDGMPNHTDTDSDGDGLLDSVEAGVTPAFPIDTDSDGDPDYLDLDSDNDGVQDGATAPPPAAGPDTDGDGIPNTTDLDDDNDGLLDVKEGAVDANNDGVLDASSTDTDGDGTPDAWDLDSDNDGILDLWEASNDIALMGSLDVVVNGAVDISFPVGTNGVPDALETAPDSGVLTIAPPVDTDGDGIYDFRDLDSDGDNIFDLIEAGGTDADGNGTIDGFTDSDGKGVDDTVQASALPIYDTDNDGTFDWRDLDSDSDAIPDAVEGGGVPNQPVDTDADGAADYRETDSDNDTIPDNTEAGSNPANPVDTDNDGDPDYQDLDSDNDGTQDGQTPPPPPASNGPDTDGDGIPNQTDLDDDNDGILDVDEGAVDANNDGVLDGSSTDTDGDGTPDAWDLDSDNDGILDLWEASNNIALMGSLDQVVNGAVDISFPVGTNGVPDALETSPDSGVLTIAPVQDTDSDGIPDFRDLDSDADNIFDLVEAGGTDSDGNGTIDGFVDTDGKGVDDTVQASALPIYDTDNDGTFDWRDLDSDNDTIPDMVEGGGSPNQPMDTDGDGAPDYRETDSDNDTIPDATEAGGNPSNPADTDGDGSPDYQDLDSDNDGTQDGGTPPNPPTNPPPATSGPDTDGDGIPNQVDLDDDNDGIPDTVEGAVDNDNDGVLDGGSTDTDGDGTPDAWDLDSDNDGILDNEESRVDLALVQSLDQVVNGAIDIGVPVGANGLADIIETAPDSGLINYTVVDTDGDGVPDFRDIDSDGDGINDLIEAGGGDADNDGRIDNFNDADGKGVDDFVQANALPVFDTDGDLTPDYRDTDSDNDTIPDSVERGPIPNIPADTDGDGAFDYREQDSDGDTLPDNVEAGGNPSTPVDTDGDGTPDFQDLDSDNDTVPDNMEQPAAPTGPASSDMDGDGIDNSVDIDDDNDGILDVDEGTGDADFDGVANQYDLDSDNDGLFDIQEANLALSHSITLDADGNGIIDGNNFGANGFADVLETAPESGLSVYLIADADLDGVADFLDIDSDNDSIYDAEESKHPDNNVDGRIDFNGSVTQSGVVAGVAGGPYLDTDKDGVVDFRDVDSDNDGLVDLVEAGGSDLDGNGRIDGFADGNGDGADDAQAQSPVITPDTDGDRIRDFRDLDSDNDGLSDLLESGGPAYDLDNDGMLDNFLDGNGDGLDDNTAGQPILAIDTDGDAFPDHLDLDSDGDGLFDITETNGGDTNQDGVVDAMTDSDNDGIPDVNDVDQTGGVDADFDGIDDSVDVTFAGGLDSDGDGVIDSADPDADGDGFAGINDDGATSNQNFPDEDNNGVLDFQQVDGNVNPNAGASSGIVETGLSGTGFGCSIAPTLASGKSVSKSSIDPTLPLFGLLAMGWLFRRRAKRVATVVTLASVAAVSGCGSFDLPTWGSGSDDNAGSPSYGGNDFNRRIYIGAGAGPSHLAPDASKVPAVSINDSASAGGQLTLGIDLTNRLSAEIHGGDIGAATMLPTGEIGYQVGGLSGIAYLINDEYDRGRREGLNLFGRLGIGGMKNQAVAVPFERINDYHLLAGIGLEYGFDFGLAARAELISFDEDAQLAQFGLVYRFGDHDDEPVAPRAPAPAPIPVPAPEVAPVPVEPADSDQDGVPNAYDDCPASPAGSPVNAEGCPLFNGVIEGVTFETSSAQLTAEATAILEGTAQTLLQYPDLRVTVEAHTDNQGSASSNLELSKRRAISVAKFLVERGVSGSRLQPQAFGESKPRASNATAEGRRMNRRVEFKTL